MKAKFKGKGRFKDLLLAHGEKLGMVLVGLCVVWFVYAALTSEGLDASKQPDQLKKLVERAQKNIKILSYDELPDENKPQLTDYRPASVMKKIDTRQYAIHTPLNPPEFRPRIKRGDPQLLPIENLEVAGGVGLLAIKDPDADPSGRAPGRLAAGRMREDDEAMMRARARPPTGAASARGRSTARGRPPTRRGSERTAGPRGPMMEEDDEGIMGGYARGGLAPRGRVGAVPQGGVRVGPTDKVEAHYWAVLLAKVPIVRQMELYQRAFQDAEEYQPQYDVPSYYGYVVQRAEVDGDGEPKWKTVKAVNLDQLDKILADWTAEVPPMIDPRYMDDLLTFPLPPLVGRDWDESITHTDVPLATALYGPGYGPGGEAEATEGEEEPEVDEHGFADAPDETALDGPGLMRRPGASRAPRPRRPAPGRGRAMPGAGREMLMEDYDGYARQRGRGPSRRMPRRAPLGRREMMMGGRTGAWGPQEEEIPHMLFRFFDLTVKPGHRYQYRVKLALYDPNHEVEQKYLSDTVIERRGKAKNRLYVLSPWSEPSPIVSVPFPGQLFAGPAKPVRPEQHYAEPTANVLFTMLDQEEGVEGATELEKMRCGAVGNFKRTTEVQDHSLRQGGSRSIEDFAFVTNTTLLDVRGGQSLSHKNKELTEPGELLLLDPAGRLVVRTEMGDQDPYRRYQAMLAAQEPDSDRRRGRPGARRGEEDELFRGYDAYDKGGGRARGRNTRDSRQRSRSTRGRDPRDPARAPRGR